MNKMFPGQIAEQNFYFGMYLHLIKPLRRMLMDDNADIIAIL